MTERKDLKKGIKILGKNFDHFGSLIIAWVNDRLIEIEKANCARAYEYTGKRKTDEELDNFINSL